nr:carotenoid cleavage dioxygenase 7, chloroplastic [Ipomoea batatas]
MLAKACHNITTPPKFPPAVKLPQGAATTSQVSFPNRHVSRAISIPTTTITPTTPEILTSPELLDDRVTAYWDYQFLFVSQRSEAAEPVALRVVEGAIPSDFPSGTYYLTGPGLFTDDHGSTVHPLDGHGYLRTFGIDGATGNVTFMARYIRTEAQAEERDPETGQWRFTHRGPFSVLKGENMVGNTKVMKNVANTSVLQWGGRLFCLWEGGDPYEIDSGSLDTVGKFQLIAGGHESTSSPSDLETGKFTADFWDVAAQILKPILYGVFKMPPKRFLSHYKIDARRNRLIIASCNAEDMLLPRSNFTFYELDANFKLLHQQEFNIPDHLMIHDWAFTDSNYILFGNRIKLDVPGSMTAVCGLSPMISALSVNPSKQTSPIYLLPRFPRNVGIALRVVSVKLHRRLWVLHVGNAFEDRDEMANVEISIQASGYDWQKMGIARMLHMQWQHRGFNPICYNFTTGDRTWLFRALSTSMMMGKGQARRRRTREAMQYNTGHPVLAKMIALSWTNFPIFGFVPCRYVHKEKFLPCVPFCMMKELPVSQILTQWITVDVFLSVGEYFMVVLTSHFEQTEDVQAFHMKEQAALTHRQPLHLMNFNKITANNLVAADLPLVKYNTLTFLLKTPRFIRFERFLMWK